MWLVGDAMEIHIYFYFELPSLIFSFSKSTNWMGNWTILQKPAKRITSLKVINNFLKQRWVFYILTSDNIEWNYGIMMVPSWCNGFHYESLYFDHILLQYCSVSTEVDCVCFKLLCIILYCDWQLAILIVLPNYSPSVLLPEGSLVEFLICYIHTCGNFFYSVLNEVLSM